MTKHRLNLSHRGAAAGSLNSRWARADAPGAAELKVLLDQMQPRQRLRMADGVIRTPVPGADPAAVEPTSERRAAPSNSSIDLVGYQIQRAAGVDSNTRECELSFSSEEPYPRWWGIEVLGHKAGEIDMGWISTGYAPLLKDHDRDDQIGVVSKAWLSAGKARAKVRFGKSECAEQEMQDVADGIRVNVSVGYEIRELELVKVDGEERTYRVTDWLPLECSLVSIPADMTVGVGRSADSTAPAVPRSTTLRQPEKSMPQEIKPAEGDNAFRAAVASITTLADAYAQWVKPGDVAKAIADGANAQKFQDMIMSRLANPAQDATTTAAIGLTKKETARYSFLRAIQAQIPGASADASLELEVSRTIAQAVGRQAEGIFIPADLFGTAKQQRDFSVGTAGEAGNLVQTSVMGEMFTDVLRPMLVLAQLGITILPGLRSNVAIPRKTVAGTLAMLTEIAAASETQPTTALVTLSPKRVSAYTDPSKQAIIQSEVGIEAMIRDDLLSGAAVLIENQGINGSGSSPNARGIRNVAGIGSVVGGTNGLALAWSHITGLEAACANANAGMTDRAGYLINTKAVNTAKNVVKATNLPFLWDGGSNPLNGYRAAVSNNVPSNLTKGSSSGICSSAAFSSDWSMFVLGLFGGLDITVDPYTLATTGQIRLTLNQFIDFACRQPGAFAVMDDMLTP
jgi:HK97 family phage major capsid protein